MGARLLGDAPRTMRTKSIGGWFVLVAALTIALPVEAQDEADAEGAPEAESDSRDVEARAVFDAGSTAFEDSRYADALDYFQRAYELSGRHVLLYNIGVAADRLRRDAVALEAFERFLAEVPEHPRRRDVEARVEVLRAAVESGEEAPAEGGGGQAIADEGAVTTPEPAASGGPDVVTIVGATSLGVLGLAGVVAGVIGIAGAGECLDTVGTTCVEERQTDWVGTGTYLGLGLAAVTGAVIWLIVGLSGGGGEEAAVSVGPNGELTWSF